MNRFIISLLLAAIGPMSVIFSQKLNYGLSIGTSINKTALSSTNNYEDNIYDNSSLFNKDIPLYEGAGINIGVHTKLNISQKFKLLSNLEC